MRNVEPQTLIQMPAPAAPLLVRRAAVLGTDLAGPLLATQLANAGIPVLLLDLPGEQPQSARAALKALAQFQPTPFHDADGPALITPGNLDDDLVQLANCDWVLEAVTGPLQLKTALYQRILPVLKPSAVLTTHSSGLSIAALSEGLGEGRRRFFGTHFLLPARSQSLLELIPTSMSNPALVAGFAAFADLRLGKIVVESRDTPNFIANRIEIEALFAAGRLMLEQDLSLEEVDSLTTAVLGRSHTSFFHLADQIGIDALALMAAHQTSSTASHNFALLLQQMVAHGWLGDKAGQGFYRQRTTPEGPAYDVLDLARMEYRPPQKPVPAAKAFTAAEYVRSLFSAEQASQQATPQAARFLRPFLEELWSSATARIGEAADNVYDVDRAMRAGFHWELGPFELWDAAGVEASLQFLKAQNQLAYRQALALLASGQTGWYAAQGRACFDPVLGNLLLIARTPGHRRVADYRRSSGLVSSSGVVRRNAGASLVDLGDGVGGIELHSLKNAIGGDVLSLLLAILDAEGEAVRRFRAFVLSGDRNHFSVGANLLQILLLARQGDWQELDAYLRSFQQMTSALKFCPRPVVVAPFGHTLGGGAEICLHAVRCQPHAETCIGLVEAAVGLLPSGGGIKEMLLRALDNAAAVAPPNPLENQIEHFAPSIALHSALHRAFMTIAQARVSTSAAGGRRLGLFNTADRITMNRERQLEDAKLQAIALAAVGYAPPMPRTNLPAPGQAAFATLERAICTMNEAGRETGPCSDHDAKVARKIAEVLTASTLAPGTLLAEQTILDLEREAFLSLAGEGKTQERIAYTLKTGKPLRN
ncbi:3-hydroxyacyl-CoA dehydrogenase NAD-binding domain-containing protein [Telmatobacter bradus]|uniref:3-hydroxyacyl-CoA dehydrogenase/enoyl-CoA hydratase family protein n=1 Tax=Telmatobacter bradus TaxID=474953 RepID=UPI003B435F28